MTFLLLFLLLLLALVLAAANIGSLRLSAARQREGRGERSLLAFSAVTLSRGLGNLALIGVAGVAWLAMAVVLPQALPSLHDDAPGLYAFVFGVLDVGFLLWRVIAWDL
jgi:hypothetical protein